VLLVIVALGTLATYIDLCVSIRSRYRVLVVVVWMMVFCVGMIDYVCRKKREEVYT
jgi:hypothetical protein